MLCKRTSLCVYVYVCLSVCLRVCVWGGGGVDRGVVMGMKGTGIRFGVERSMEVIDQ